MSEAVYSQMFSTHVTEQYQNSLKLKNTIDERHGLVGTVLNIPISDLIEMKGGTFEPTDILATRVNETNVQVPTGNYYVKTVIGGGEKTLYAFQKIPEHARLHAHAVGRLLDFIKINAIYTDPAYASGKIKTVALKTGKNTGLNVEKLAEANSLLEDEGIDIDPSQVTMWLPSRIKPTLTTDGRVDNIFMNSIKPLVNYEITTYMGLDIRTIGAAGINSIPYREDPTTKSRTFQLPIIHKDAMVQGFNREVTTSISWVAWQDRWELLTSITTGGKLIKPEGVVLIEAESRPQAV